MDLYTDSTTYRYDQYGCEAMGYIYYKDHCRGFIRASQCCYVRHRCYDNWCALG